MNKNHPVVHKRCGWTGQDRPVSETGRGARPLVCRGAGARAVRAARAAAARKKPFG